MTFRINGFNTPLADPTRYYLDINRQYAYGDDSLKMADKISSALMVLYRGDKQHDYDQYRTQYKKKKAKAMFRL